MERIIELNPDLVIVKTGALFPQEEEQMLVDYGISVLRYRTLHIDTLVLMISDLGRVLETEEKASDMVDEVTGYYNTILDRTKTIPTDLRPSVYFMSMGHFD